MIHLPANETEDVEGQIKDGKGSKCDEEEDDSKTPPSPDGQTGLKHTNTERERELMTLFLIFG